MSAPGSVADVAAREREQQRSPLFLERIAEVAEEHAEKCDSFGNAASAAEFRRIAARSRDMATNLRNQQRGIA